MSLSPMTRRQLLALAGGAPFAAAAAEAIPLDIRAFGALGDGRHDDTEAIQKAIDKASVGRGVVSIPPCNVSQGKYWRITRPLFLRSNVSVIGQGVNSLLYNDRKESTTFMDQAVVLPGNYHPEFLNTIEFDTARIIDQSKGIIAVANTSARYSSGQTVFVRSQDYDRTRPAVSISSLTTICRVITVRPDTIVVDRSIQFNGPVVVAPADEQVRWRPVGPPSNCFVCINSSLENLAIRSEGFWTGDTAARGCKFTNLWIQSRVGIYGNLFQECHWKNIHLTFDRLAIELACNSTDVVVEGLYAKMSGDPESPIHQIIAIQESAMRCIVRDFFIDADAFTKTAPVVRFGPSSHCVISGGKILCKQARGTMISFDTGAAQVVHNRVRDVEFHANSGAVGIAFEPRQNGEVSNNQVDNVRIEGLTMAVAARIGGTSNTISNCRLTGNKVVVLPSAANCVVRDSSIPGRIDLSGPQSESVNFLRNETRR
ncbi:right-handed parallel beta-helix repeat-containing protein [Bradyrhizobium sp. 143]|nr:right-handed parallel beta-helix repeat-containing protein [Bradyrhizobium sp. 143]MCK1731750.1 right-handed parallel beta-helix repeat-containing protein [Bradyrhizobium sp. 142]